MSRKKQIRAAFRTAVFTRDGYRCRCCGVAGHDRQAEPHPSLSPLDAHHITDRSQMPHGGYVPENGISVCDRCHLLAEQFWQTGTPALGFAPDDLYARVGSSRELAEAASHRLGD